MITIKTNSEELLTSILKQFYVLDVDSRFSFKTFGFYYTITFNLHGKVS
jgi:hypothetical protein